MVWMDDQLGNINNENLSGYIGFNQLLAGSLLQKGKRPQYTPPGAAGEGLGLARMQAYATARPGDAQALNQINQTANQQLSGLNRNLTSATQVLAGAQGINQNQMQAVQQNNALNAQFKFNAFQNLQRTLQNYAQYQDKAFMLNKLNPYMDRVNTKAALIGSGLQNINNWNNYKLQRDQWDQYFGNEKPNASNTGLNVFGLNNLRNSPPGYTGSYWNGDAVVNPTF